MNDKWYILNRNGAPQKTADLPARPTDAQPVDEGGEFTPWYKQYQHVHVQNGKITGIHAKGNLKDLQTTLADLIEYEDIVLRHFGNNTDISLEAAIDYLASQHHAI